MPTVLDVVPANSRARRSLTSGRWKLKDLDYRRRLKSSEVCAYRLGIPLTCSPL